MEQHSFEDVWQLKEKIKDAAKSTASDKKSDNYYSLFQRFEGDSSSFVYYSEINKLLGSDLSHVQIDEAYSLLDQHENGMVDIIEFETWYKGNTALVLNLLKNESSMLQSSNLNF